MPFPQRARSRARTSAPPALLRRIRRVGFLTLAAGLAYVAVGIACFVVPHSDPLPKRADVAFVLGDPTPQRARSATELLRRGVVDEVQASVPEVDHVLDYVRRWCSSDPRVHCAAPRPSTTQGEARMLRDAANAQGWTSAVVITQNSHLLRARWTLSRCYPGHMSMLASGEAPFRGWAYQFAYQTASTAKNLLITPGC